ncbi:DNA-binding helix-turn-helix protein [Leptospira weilii str. 2006001853]|uniref:DNA-binding helix-turn-helix protein n=3 Tax=Leptospira weilii TaxID=28184 RepID=A0A828Z8E2_9LEPT|nr:helix-turn-helix transcriptional regulator [Leptospira weilii]EMM74325.1 DNA-binding helix-turn-helix protein [Leptospira weilii str. 2006001855]EKR66664.1 DNA-binding helix-turn-helix protein [Leptospira weilii str. 2006001853]EMN45978.1 DNA-binding helix-turn-helix protein [Leptospira weilii str. LNT 1234]EMN91895.1 DNA-binding helix-turn-helix protein [Leptospira weilii str. UI 13098]MCL8267301.1 helix-turn-helix domain-containing protein [Leptospira weilii]
MYKVNKKFSDRLKRLIETLGFSQAEFARSIDLKPAFISDLINERAKSFSQESLLRLRTIHNVNPLWLIAGEGEMLITEIEIKTDFETDRYRAILKKIRNRPQIEALLESLLEVPDSELEALSLIIEKFRKKK